ncbi:MAG: PTS sugar transporter subunit IIC [Anaerolineae bacterium]|nr:PTS sugar transporter subunit IIC [Anaerolineae bacterium]
MAVEKKWHEKFIVDPLNKFANLRIIKSISGGIASGVNILLIGSILSIISILMSFIPGLKETEFSVKFFALKELVFGIVGVFFAYSIGAANAKYNKIDKQSVGFFAVIVYYIFMRPEFVINENGITLFQAEFSKFGTNGIFVSLVSGLWAGEITNFFKKHGWVMKSEGLPEIIQTWFDYLIAGTVVTLSAWAFTDLLNVDLFTIFSTILIPIIDIFSSFWGTLLLAASGPLLFYFGIHPLSVLYPVFAVYIAAAAHNADLLARGLAPTLANGFIINNYGTLLMINLGGAGSTLGLNIALLFSKSETHRKLGRLAILPGILNINEPLIFGLPIIFNPAFFIPYVIVPIINQAIAYFVLFFGWVRIPASLALSMHIPSVINAYILTEDYRAIFLVLILITLDALIWVPFLKTHARQQLIQETQKSN